MKKNILHVRIALLFFATLTAAAISAGSRNDAVDFSNFNSSWIESPSAAIAQISSPLMELAAAAKTNAASQMFLQETLLHLVSTNAIITSGTNLLSKKHGIIIDAFRASGTFSSPQEDEILPLAKTLALITKSYQINTSRMRESHRVAPEKDASGIVILDDETVKIMSLQRELLSAFSRIRTDMLSAMSEMNDAPQQVRENLFGEIISMRVLTQSEVSKLAESLGIAQPVQSQQNRTD